ncbi:hypothetical protein JRI60_52180 [Archangium violaceum]|uniref:hypothetical protein n=1 Tax=Archangium violaceum TaxID=83451 RepID=UPI0019524FE3|nr:hypothetical protein [Archangium violaceum]QRN97408.1 hypothetical protein JRI60_52180 [Archangium violaceum]
MTKGRSTLTQPASPRRGVLASLVLVLALGLGSSAAAEVTVSGRALLLLAVGERRLQVRVESKRISGGGLELRRTGNGLRGTLRNLPVELTWDEDGNITGRAAGASVELVALPRSPQPGMELRGWFGADTAELSLTPTGIAGSVGGCGYSLPLAGNHYSGWRTCDETRGPPVPVTLRIPSNVIPLAQIEEGALLALLLSDEALPPASSAGESPGQGGAGAPSP